jgi:hypothetical protein
MCCNLTGSECGTQSRAVKNLPITNCKSSEVSADFLATRHELLFDREIPVQTLPIFGGVHEDRYVSSFLEGNVYENARSVVSLPDRVSRAIEVLRISALSSYEDKRISTGALLFESFPDACHSVPARPDGALSYSSDLTSIRSFHRICDGLRTLALVDATGAMVELIDVEEWAQAFRRNGIASPDSAPLPDS